MEGKESSKCLLKRKVHAVVETTRKFFFLKNIVFIKTFPTFAPKILLTKKKIAYEIEKNRVAIRKRHIEKALGFYLSS
ncbi:MAG: hypothetical protein LBE91_20525 [Tannerella sp.]|jgi:hypothetical protein|nr:hypothetical protein [Tannerella sp.]